MLEDKIVHFLDYCKSSDFTEKSIDSLKRQAKAFNLFISDFNLSSPKLITYQHIRTFVAEHNNPSIHIKKARIWTLRQFFHFLKLNGWVDKNIATGLPYPKIEKTVPIFLSIEDYNRLLSYFYKNAYTFNGMRNLIVIMMLGILGLRLASIINIDTDDIDLAAGLVRIHDKGRVIRTIVLPKIICETLSHYLKNINHGPLFLSKRHKRISARTLQDIFKQATDDLNIEVKLHAHLFRHTAATHLTRMSDYTITKHVLGHKSLKNTIKYSHLNPDKYAVYMKFHPYIEIKEV